MPVGRDRRCRSRRRSAAGSAEADLNAFLAAHKILSIDRRFIDQGAESAWCFCIDFLATGRAGNDGRHGVAIRGKVDYREVLSADEFAVYSRLRDWRKQISQAEAVPVYTVFTNEQLAQAVQRRAASKADLEQIAGVGDARVQKYGDRLLVNPLDGTDRSPVLPRAAGKFFARPARCW